MTKLTDDITPPIAINSSARNISRNQIAGTAPNEESPFSPSAEVQVLRMYVCELLRKNQELRYALSGVTTAELDG